MRSSLSRLPTKIKMKGRMNSDTNKKIGLALAVGAAAGWAATLLLRDDQKAKYRREIKKLGAQLSDTEVAKRLEDLYQDQSDTAREKYENARDAVMSQVANLQENWDNLDLNKYSEVIAQTLEDLRERKEISRSQVDKLQAYFESDLDKLRSSAKKTARKARRVGRAALKDQPRA